MTDTDNTPKRSEEKHKKKMKKMKESVDKRIAEATEERGVLLVITGDGKGKSTSAMGTALRAAGYGQKVAIIQFIKGAQETGERLAFEKLPNVEYHVMGTGFTWDTQDQTKDIEATNTLWAKAAPLLADESVDLVVLDEITYVINYGYLPLETLTEALKNRPLEQSVIITGRGAGSELLELADTVSDVKNVKHAFKSGIKARKGVEY